MSLWRLLLFNSFMHSILISTFTYARNDLELSTFTNASNDLELCKQAIEQINSNELDLLNSTKTLLDVFNETCHDEATCQADANSIGSTVKRNFTSLQGESLRPMESVCNSMGEGFSLCFATTEISNGNLRTKEINKPVCFPPSCSETDIILLDDMCGTAPSCEIVSAKAHCPGRNKDVHLETCDDDAKNLKSNRRLNRFRKGLHQSMVKQCVNVVLGSQSTVCDVSSRIKVSAMKNFTAFDTDEVYLDFVESCMEHGGISCKISMSSIGQISPSTSFFDFDFEVEYTKHPFCKPIECANENPNIFAEKILFDSGFDCFENECNINVTSISCD